MISKAWAYIELVDKPVLYSLSLIAMVLRIDASRFVAYVEAQDTPTVLDLNDISIRTLFSNPSEYDIYINSLLTIYPNTNKHIRLKSLSTTDILSNKTL